jgi:hypothetical protein
VFHALVAEDATTTLEEGELTQEDEEEGGGNPPNVPSTPTRNAEAVRSRGSLRLLLFKNMQ